MEVDLVYLWVDGNDPAWQKKHSEFTGAPMIDRSADCKGRYVDNEELKYSLRSVEQYAPWIRKIFIVTDNQVPKWLATSNPKVEIVDHKEILPPESLPCFNSVIIEHHLYKIPGLAEHFLYANDDMLLNKPVKPEDFFTPEGYPIIRMRRRPFNKLVVWFRDKVLKKPLGNYNRKINNSALLVEDKFGKYYGGKPHHNIDSYCKSHFVHVVELLKDKFSGTYGHHIRSNEDYQRSVFHFAALAEGKGKLKYVDSHTSFQLAIHKPYHYPRLEKDDPMFFCMNDGPDASDEDRKRAAEYLADRFPEKSSFEK